MSETREGNEEVYANWGSVETPGKISVRIETLNANRKPSGTLVDANAVATGITPTGIEVGSLDRIGTPAKDLRVRFFSDDKAPNHDRVTG
jgi:hypothetical protein